MKSRLIKENHSNAKFYVDPHIHRCLVIMYIWETGILFLLKNYSLIKKTATDIENYSLVSAIKIVCSRSMCKIYETDTYYKNVLLFRTLRERYFKNTLSPRLRKLL